MKNYLKKYEKIDLKYNLKTLWGFVKKYRWSFYGLIFLMLLNEIFAFLDNFAFKYLVDKGTLFSQGNLSPETLWEILLIIVFLFILLKIISALFWFITLRVVNLMEAKVMNDIEKKSFWHILTLSYRFHLNKRTGSLISQFTRGVNKVEAFGDAIIFNFIPVFFRILLSVGVIFYFDIATSLVVLITCVLFAMVGIYFTNLQKVPQNIANYHEDNLKQNLSDVFQNIETVKYFAKEKDTYHYFSTLSEKLKVARNKFWNYFSWLSAIDTLVLGLGIAAIFYFSFTGLMQGRISLGSITLIYAAVWRLIPMLFNLMHGYRQFIRSSVDVDALFQMFKEENEVIDLPEAKKLQVAQGKIEFKNVSFAYPASGRDNRTVIKNFSHILKPNTKVALVGPSGGGKTTVIKLLYRLFDLPEGQILIDEQDIHQVAQESLRNSISVVPQEPILFDNTLWFNIAYANPRAGKRKVWQAIRFAQLDKFIAQLPKKEKTIVGERGVKLSGGEKQRVSIARAILADKKILVLDEATSALDSETEKEIQACLEKLMKNRTTIMIAHRLSTIMKADEIIVLDQGRIVEIGTHDQLANKQGGLYQRLWGLQRGGRL
ncbi:MAG TPA: ABC transporter ATP-binding protein [Candidatus Nanoarchaeia archaeon]|nr:ABC transporter ATP-binding protein [Candidatus Nanoarchaeia archaeon]